MTAVLLPGEAFGPNTGLRSPNARYHIILQNDGNLVLYEGTRAIWASNTAGSGAMQAIMQTDGNFVLYRPGTVPVWSSNSQGNPGAHLEMQDDANVVIYGKRGVAPIAPVTSLTGMSPSSLIKPTAQVALGSSGEVAIWSTKTWGGYIHEESSWLADAVRTVGTPFVVVTHGIADVTNKISDIASSIPLVGPAFHGILAIGDGPFKFTNQVIDGERLDRALINELSAQVAAVREVAPYAQTVIAFIPGIGQGVSAAIGAGLALAQGKSIDEALVEAVRDAIPGGAVAKIAFDLVYAAATGKNMIEAAGKSAIKTLGLPDVAAQAFNVVYRAAQGENIPMAVLDQARSYLPQNPAVLKAFDVGLALAHGERLQQVALKQLVDLAPAQIEQIQAEAAPILAKVPALQYAKSIIANPVAQTGFQFGMGVMAHSGVNAEALQAVRSGLPVDQKKGFDLGVAAWQGTVKTNPPAAVKTDPAMLAGYVLTKGLNRYPDPVFKKETLTALAKNPKSQAGMVYAQKEIASQQGFFTWLWHLVAG